MSTTFLTLALAALLGGEPAKAKPREPSPLAPSLPLLTDDEEDQLDLVIDRFIKHDTGQLPSTESRKAVQEFEKLGLEAVPALIRGLNKAAHIDYSCPAVSIAQKLARMLRATEDQELLQFARENIGAGVTESQHMAVLLELRFACTTRKNLLARQAALEGPKSPRAMTTTELAEAAGSERGSRLRQVLTELGQRQGADAINALGVAASSYEDDIKRLAKDLLVKNLSRQGPTVIKDRLKDDRAEVRAAAARVIGTKVPSMGGELIDVLSDDDAAVRDAAHQALVRLNLGTDLGPAPKASDSERAAAVEKWRDWWSRKGGR
jgi:hypothetical protein